MNDILTTADLVKRWGCGSSTIAERWRTGKMPAPFNPDQKRGFRWHRAVIDSYERGEWTPAEKAS